MHPLIRNYPSNQFYSGAITDGRNTVERKLMPEMAKLHEFTRRTVFFDLDSSHESKSG